jgi:hypothetical protein
VGISQRRNGDLSAEKWGNGDLSAEEWAQRRNGDSLNNKLVKRQRRNGEIIINKLVKRKKTQI